MAGKREAVLEVLHSVAGLVLGQPGCLDAAVFEQSGAEKAILYLDQWISLEDLIRHVHSEPFLRVLLAMELGARAPEISIHEVWSTKGLPWIEAQWGEGGPVR